MGGLFMPPYLHVCYFTHTRYYIVAKRTVFKAELVFYFLPPCCPNCTPAVASCPRGCQELSLAQGQNPKSSCVWKRWKKGLRGEGHLLLLRNSRTPCSYCCRALLTQTTGALKRGELLLALTKLAF